MKKKYFTIKQLYFLIIIFNFLFWFFILSSIYTSNSVLRIEEIKENDFNFGNHLAQNYEPSLPGCYLFAEWLRSEKAYTLLHNNLNMNSFYQKGDFFTRHGGIYSLFMHGDRSEWSYFRRHLSVDINNNSYTINLAFSSYDQKDSQKVLYEIISIGKEYLKFSHQEEDQKQKDYIYSLSLSLSYDLKNINKKIEEYIKEGISIYPKESYLNTLLIKNIIEKKLIDVNSMLNSTGTLNSPVYKNWVSQKRFILGELDKSYDQNILQAQNNEKMELVLRKRNFLQTLSQQVEQKKYILQRANYIDKYKINIVSPPSLFEEQSGPYRVKGFIISLLIISLIYWLVKE